jgi:hypothetical protein
MSMTGPEFLAYVLRTFKRTDKNTEVYEAITDAVKEIRRRHYWSDDQIEAYTNSGISALGDYKVGLPSDMAGFIGRVRCIDGTNGWILDKLSKDEFDATYPDAVVTANYGVPEHFCIFRDHLYIGPVPDKTSYQYEINYLEDDQVTITAATTSVPFSAKNPDILKYKTLALTFQTLGAYEHAAFWDTKAERELALVIDREKDKDGAPEQARYFDT